MGIFGYFPEVFLEAHRAGALDWLTLGEPMLCALLFGQGGTGQPVVGYDYGSFHVM